MIGDIGTGDLPAIVASVIAIAACVAGLLRALQHFQSRRNGGIPIARREFDQLAREVRALSKALEKTDSSAFERCLKSETALNQVSDRLEKLMMLLESRNRGILGG